MQKHTKAYMKAFGYEIGDYIPSEISGLPAVDIHHIDGRGKGKDVPENLIALTRKEHERAELRTKPYLRAERLKEIHNNFIKTKI